MSSPKKIYLYFAAGVYLSEAPSPPMTRYHPSYTMYTCIQFTYSHREGGEGGGES